jgi:hypothetical protein
MPARQEQAPLGGKLIKPFIDTMLVLLCVYVMLNPAFDVQEASLPLLTTTGLAGEAAAPRAAFTMHLRADGTALWQGQAVALDRLARRVATETQANQIVALVVDMNNGAGPLEAFLRLQLDCANLKVWDRVRILHRGQKPEGNQAQSSPSRP